MLAHRSPRMRLLASGLAALVLAGCSGSSASSFHQPAEKDFAPGGCRTVAKHVLALGRDVHGLGDTRKPSPEAQKALKSDQTALRGLQKGLTPTLAPVVQELVTAVGFVRLRTDIHSYTPQLAKTAVSAYDKVVAACTKA